MPVRGGKAKEKLYLSCGWAEPSLGGDGSTRASRPALGEERMNEQQKIPIGFTTPDQEKKIMDVNVLAKYRETIAEQSKMLADRDKTIAEQNARIAKLEECLRYKGFKIEIPDDYPMSP
jgi:hypothetical protein